MSKQVAESVPLQELAQQLSWRFWQKECAIPVLWNGRLTRTMGRFTYVIAKGKRTPIHIEISKKAAACLDQETFAGILLHELCHYHLFMQNKPFADHHPYFEAELQRVGALSTNTVRMPVKGYILLCSRCGAELGQRRRFNARNYRSACCQQPIDKREAWL